MSEIQLILDQKMNDVRTVGLEGDGWKRIVVVIAKDDGLRAYYDNGNPNRLILELTPNPVQP